MAGGWVTCTQKRFCLPNPVNVHRDTLNHLGFVGRSDLQTKGSPTSRSLLHHCTAAAQPCHCGCAWKWAMPGMLCTPNWCWKRKWWWTSGFRLPLVPLVPHDIQPFSNSIDHGWQPNAINRSHQIPGDISGGKWPPKQVQTTKKRFVSPMLLAILGWGNSPKKSWASCRGLFPLMDWWPLISDVDQGEKGPISTTEKCFLEIWLTCGYGSKPGTLVDSRCPKS